MPLPALLPGLPLCVDRIFLAGAVLRLWALNIPACSLTTWLSVWAYSLSQSCMGTQLLPLTGQHWAIQWSLKPQGLRGATHPTLSHQMNLF